MATKILSMEERCQFYERMRGSIVCIKDDRGRLIGGGVFVKVGSRQLVLTVAHVVYKKKHLRIVCCDKKSYAVHLRHLDRIRDVGLLDVSYKPNGGFECAQLCDKNELVRTTEVHFIGHPGRQKFTYNIGNISCVERTCGDIYKTELALDILPDFLRASSEELIDDFRGLDGSVRLVQAKNVHGGGRFGGTGAPFLDSDGHIVGLYSFTFREEDFAIHVADVRASIESLV